MADDGSAAPARVRNRWGEGERLREEILGAASRLLSGMDGEDGLTIRGVAREAGIAPASIYQHFADRAELVHGLLEYDFARLRALMREADGNARVHDPVGRVRAQLHAYCAFAVENPGHYRLMLSNGVDRTGPLLAVLAEVTEAFRRCEDSGFPLQLSAERASVIVVVGVHGRVALLYGSVVDRGVRAAEQYVDELLALVFALFELSSCRLWGEKSGLRVCVESRAPRFRRNRFDGHFQTYLTYVQQVSERSFSN